jgi:hypothetical protein
LSNASTKALEKWITASGKKRTDYLFPGRGVDGRHPMGQRQLNRLLKLWVVEAGLDPSDYSVESCWGYSVVVPPRFLISQRGGAASLSNY